MQLRALSRRFKHQRAVLVQMGALLCALVLGMFGRFSWWCFGVACGTVLVEGSKALRKKGREEGGNAGWVGRRRRRDALRFASRLTKRGGKGMTGGLGGWWDQLLSIWMMIEPLEVDAIESS